MMKKENLDKIILRYSGVAGAFLGANALQAQDSIVHIDIPDTTLSANGAYFNINMDQDTSGIVDFRLNLLVDSTVYDFSGVTIQKGSNSLNQVAGMDYGLYNYPFKLNVGEKVGSGSIFKGISNGRNIGYLGLSVGDTTYPNSKWTGGVTDGFLGVRFRTLQNDTMRTFYGWIRLDVAADLKSVTIKDWGYRTAADSAITMGQGSPIGIHEELRQMDRPSLAQRGRYLDIGIPESFNQAEAVLKIMDLSGREVIRTSLSGYKNSYELENIPNGIYIATVSSNGIEVSKKIAVY